MTRTGPARAGSAWSQTGATGFESGEERSPPEHRRDTCIRALAALVSTVIDAPDFDSARRAGRSLPQRSVRLGGRLPDDLEDENQDDCAGDQVWAAIMLAARWRASMPAPSVALTSPSGRIS